MSSYFSSVALCPLRLCPSARTFFSPGMITWSPVSVRGPVSRQKSAQRSALCRHLAVRDEANGQSSFSLNLTRLLKRAKRGAACRRVLVDSQTGAQREAEGNGRGIWPGNRRKIKMKRKPKRLHFSFHPNPQHISLKQETQDSIRRVVLTNHENSTVYQMTDLFKTHNTAFGTRTRSAV